MALRYSQFKAFQEPHKHPNNKGTYDHYVPLTNGTVSGRQRIRIGEGQFAEELEIPTDLGLVE